MQCRGPRDAVRPGDGLDDANPGCSPRPDLKTRYPMVIKLALPPAAAVLTLIERSVTSHSSA